MSKESVLWAHRLTSYNNDEKLMDFFRDLVKECRPGFDKKNVEAVARNLLIKYKKEARRQLPRPKSHRRRQYHNAKTGQYRRDHKAYLDAQEQGVKVRRLFSAGWVDDYIGFNGRGDPKKR